MYADKPGNWCWSGKILGYVLFYCEHKPCYFCFNLQFCFHGNYGTGERAQRLFLHSKKIENMVFVQGVCVFVF